MLKSKQLWRYLTRIWRVLTKERQATMECFIVSALMWQASARTSTAPVADQVLLAEAGDDLVPKLGKLSGLLLGIDLQAPKKH